MNRKILKRNEYNQLNLSISDRVDWDSGDGFNNLAKVCLVRGLLVCLLTLCQPPVPKLLLVRIVMEFIMPCVCCVSVQCLLQQNFVKEELIAKKLKEIFHIWRWIIPKWASLRAIFISDYLKNVVDFLLFHHSCPDLIFGLF